MLRSLMSTAVMRQPTSLASSIAVMPVLVPISRTLLFGPRCARVASSDTLCTPPGGRLVSRTTEMSSL